VNPIFYECVQVLYEANAIDELPPIVVDCFDHDEDLIGSSVDFLSRCTVDLQHEDNVGAENDIPEPKWFPCYYKKGGPKSGEVLLSFAANDGDFAYKVKDTPDIGFKMVDTVKTEEFKVSMNILGLR